VSGEQVIIMDKNGRKVLTEAYVKFPKSDNLTETLGLNEYFVMGDNRSQSLDSRYWGPVDKSELQGRVLLRLFPFNKVGYRPGDVSK
jgi:signal peptidase I